MSSTPNTGASRPDKASSTATDPEEPDGVVDDDAKQAGLPPGASTRGEDEEAPGQVREAAPYDDAPAEGRLAPDGDNPPPGN